MKRAGGLYPLICGLKNLQLAFWKAQRGKRAKSDVQLYRDNLQMELAALGRELRTGAISVGDYHYFMVHDPKERRICAASFRERVLHHAIMNVCEPVFERYAVYDTYACRPGKGSHRAVLRARQFSGRHAWCMKMDIAKYYDTIDHGRLILLLSRRFKDRQLLKLFSDIIGSYESAPGKGLPIGNLTSQHFANYYLGPLDHYLLETLGVKGYVRYMDDMLVWGASRGELRETLMRIRTYLCDELLLHLKDATEIKPCAAGVNFLGFRVFPGRIRLGRRARRRFAEKLRQYEDNH